MQVLIDTTDHLASPNITAYSTNPFGCCGACYVVNTADFNDLTEVPSSEHWRPESLIKQFNRGILIGRNIKEEDIIKSDNSLIESFEVEGEIFFVRIRQ